MLPFELKTINETDYKLEIIEKTKDSKLLEHLFKYVLNRERQALKRIKGVALPDIDYKKLKKWSTKSLGPKETKVLMVAFNKPILAHYKNVIKDIYDQVIQDKVKLLTYQFSAMQFKKLRHGWEIKAEIIGQYNYEG